MFERYGIRAKSVPAEVDETVPENIKDPCEIVKYLSAKKAESIAGMFNDDSLIIAADTLVFCGNSVLGKPASKKEAYDMIKLLSGNVHSVISGFCIIGNGKKISESVITEVTFREISEDEINGYISTDEPYDKAGGYGIQSLAGAFVSSIKGDYYNVVGLPVSKLISVLKEEFGYDVLGELFKSVPTKDKTAGER